jgi:hypothetical protein
MPKALLGSRFLLLAGKTGITAYFFRITVRDYRVTDFMPEKLPKMTYPP